MNCITLNNGYKLKKDNLCYSSQRKTNLHLCSCLQQFYPEMIRRAAVTFLHVLTEGLNVIPGASNLHQPMEIVVNTARISLVDFDHRQKILVRHEHLVLVV